MASPSFDDLAALYHLNSGLSRVVVPQPIATTPTAVFRRFPGSRRTPLPPRSLELDLPLGQALRTRRSVRRFAPGSLEANALGILLHASYGVLGQWEHEERSGFKRPVPSAGARYPLELYVVTRSVTSIEDGLYHYDPQAHELELRNADSIFDELYEAFDRPVWLHNANLVIVISAVFERTMSKYGQRGYRYVLLEAGHLAQNLVLAATSLGLGSLNIGSFFDAELDSLVGLPADEQLVYAACVGLIDEEAPVIQIRRDRAD